MAVGGAGFEAGDQRPKLVDRVCGPAGGAGEFGQADGGFSERDHRDVVGVGGVGHADQVRRNGQGSGDVPAGGDVLHGAASGFEHEDVGGFVAELVGEPVLREAPSPRR